MITICLCMPCMVSVGDLDNCSIHDSHVCDACGVW